MAGRPNHCYRFVVRRKRTAEKFGSDTKSRTAWACIRLDRLRQGYRLIRLRDDNGPTKGALLVRIGKKVGF